MRWVYISDCGERSGHRFLCRKFAFSPPFSYIPVTITKEESVQVDEGPLLVFKWDQGLFEQITRGFQFPPEWNARYPRQGQTATDAPQGYIKLFEDFFLQGNFRLPATEFMASILHFYGFHISQMSSTGMLRVRHFEFLCRSQGMEPIVERFRAFYQLIRNIGFYSSSNRGVAKKILIGPPKSFHNWKMTFFFIREEVIAIAMIFGESDKIVPFQRGVRRFVARRVELMV
ncbi:hypothetical protein HanRHA438_Chr08g0354381 [Helianthus annuus]|uniref:Transposase (putative) gypsy type domain-containing protein n=1 Tax=Helianthus annuus TaxID=4232 RepID=A0A9K3NCX3_HELAN|nr:hypothetical protein HanXRQr2_Chr08g0342951 [Helianthus annuus]KAJ0539175.1 hypothetical protein HanHA300_Chr08g0283361 [Helianthus annuus]KAJ0547255.1 hypothetical protein HanIR_Chr08g0370141 [Helianthus annuus]KAJ0553825.1 hypothetical protein HanHA89_Chr08g0300751 [Helianthus annuus]KAJ0719484.1 hypothetical protein HanLR1_Chr08g0282281 [Helianthus annuus]